VIKQHFCIQQRIKKPQHVTVHQYMSCMGVLNDYLAYLPTVYDSAMAVKGMKKNNVPFDVAKLARVVLNSVLVTWVGQFNMTHSTLPKFPQFLLQDLKAIERVMNEKHQANLKMKVEEASAASASTRGNPKKHSASRNQSEQVQKKARPAKFCKCCKNKGGPHLTHTANECSKYNKDGNLVAVATGTPFEAKKPSKKGGHNQLAYLMATIEYLVKKGLKKAAKTNKCMHYYDSSSSDSDCK
jgi:hypothetical protein